MRTHVLVAGTGLCGKHTCINSIAENFGAPAAVTLSAGPTIRIEASVRAFGREILLEAAPGAVYFPPLYDELAARADAVIYVVDSQIAMLANTKEDLNDWRERMRKVRHDDGRLPGVVFYNKRDLPRIVSVGELEKLFNPGRLPFVETVATNGTGILEGFTILCRSLGEG